MTWKAKAVLSLTFFLLAIGTALYWVYTGARLWTLTKEKVPVIDDLWGTTSYKWQDTFKPGLEYIGPLVVVLLLLSTVFFVSSKRALKKHSD